MQWSHYCVCCTLTPCNIPSFCPGLSSPLLSTTQNPYISSLTRNGWKLSHLRRQNCWFMSSVSNRATRSSSLGFRKNWTSDLLNCWYWSIIQLYKALKASWDGGENIWRERKLFVLFRGAHSLWLLYPQEKIIQQQSWHWIHTVCSCIQGFD